MQCFTSFARAPNQFCREIAKAVSDHAIFLGWVQAVTEGLDEQNPATWVLDTPAVSCRRCGTYFWPPRSLSPGFCAATERSGARRRTLPQELGARPIQSSKARAVFDSWDALRLGIQALRPKFPGATPPRRMISQATPRLRGWSMRRSLSSSISLLVNQSAIRAPPDQLRSPEFA
jgi:hypothetical protein